MHLMGSTDRIPNTFKAFLFSVFAGVRIFLLFRIETPNIQRNKDRALLACRDYFTICSANNFFNQVPAHIAPFDLPDRQCIAGE